MTKSLSVVEGVGRGLFKITQAWADAAQAYKGVVTAGFLNLFMLYGPNTNADSLITTIHHEVEHVAREIRLHLMAPSHERIDHTAGGSAHAHEPSKVAVKESHSSRSNRTDTIHCACQPTSWPAARRTSGFLRSGL